MKKCPYCAEDIQDAAIVCKHCGRDLNQGVTQVQVAAKQTTRFVTWVGTIFVGLMFVVWVSSLINPRPSTPPVTTVATPSQSPQPAQTTPTITQEDLKRERKGRFGSRDVFAFEKDGQWIATFNPALPRDDRTVLDGAEYVLGEFLGVDTNNAKWRPVDKFLRIITGDGIFDVLIVKNDDGTVHSMGIYKK